MTPDDILAMARKAGIHISGSTPKEFERFAKLISEFDPVRFAREVERKQAIDRMAAEACWGKGSDEEEDCFECARFDLELFAALVADEEREACAKLCEAQIEEWVDDRPRYAASECAAAIRARSEK